MTYRVPRKHIESVAARFEESGAGGGKVQEVEKGRPRRLRGVEEVFQHSECEGGSRSRGMLRMRRKRSRRLRVT